MPDRISPEPAIARWLAHGVTSRTHPVLHYVLHACFQPLGIEADWLEAEPFSSFESGGAGWWLRQPRWSPARFDRQSPAAADFAYLLDHSEHVLAAVDSQGMLSLAFSAVDPGDAKDYLQSSGNGWDAIRHAVRASHTASMFIYAAAGLLLANDPIAALYAQGDDDAFCASLRSRLEFPIGDTVDDKAVATARAGSPAIGKQAMAERA